LVAPSIIIHGKYKNLSDLKKFEYDSSLKRYFNKLVIFYADDDDENIIASAKQVHKKLDGKLVMLKGKGHFVYEDMGTEEFPELLEEVLSK
jgi:predicted alpha/beta hydrolase family esterase